jgi:hypothetical protein
MYRYYVNNQAQRTGEREVHREDCARLPTQKTDLGFHSNCHSAVRQAQLYYSNVDGCIHCSTPCHTK